MIAAAVHHGYWLHWLSHFFGLDNLSGPFYGWWSGAGSDLGEYVIVVGLLVGTVHMVRRHNCREHRCWRIGIHTYLDKDGTPHPACKKHHPHMGDGHRFSFAQLHRAKQETGRPFP
jgi:hypothetical protein